LNLEYVPLLDMQRNLYAMPTGMERFEAYLDMMIDRETGDMKLPLASMNPMGKSHLVQFIDTLIGLGADELGETAVAEALHATREVAGDYRVALVTIDDSHGGWTNRYATEFGHRLNQSNYHKRGWIAAAMWSSERYTPEAIKVEIHTCIFRLVHTLQHGYPVTLGDALQQEGFALFRAGASEPTLAEVDYCKTRSILAPLLNESAMHTIMPALFGDDAADEFGYSQLGLPPRAGLALALHDARSESQRAVS